MKIKPNIFLSLLFGFAASSVFFGALVLSSITFGQLNVLVVTGWAIIFLGFVMGLQIHIVRKLKYSNDNGQGEIAKVQKRMIPMTPQSKSLEISDLKQRKI